MFYFFHYHSERLHARPCPSNNKLGSESCLLRRKGLLLPCQRSSRSSESIPARRWAWANLRGWGQSLSPTAPQHLKLPVTCCHRPAHRHFPRTRPDRSRLQRDAGQVGKKGRETPLCVAKARGMWDLSRRELALNRALRTSAPLFFPHRFLGGRKQEGARGGVAL